jgi:malate dehydrogenase
MSINFPVKGKQKVNIAIIGAGGSVGREISRQIITSQLLEKQHTLILCGNPEGASAKTLYGFKADLQDGYAEFNPQIEVMLDPEKISADIIVFAAGSTLKPNMQNGVTQRESLSELNAPIFHQYAETFSKKGKGHELYIIISNPNELAVSIFSKYIHRSRVIGMGAFLDSLRFRKEIAADLNIRRQRIHAFMIGEHGPNMVPLWSSVHIFGLEGEVLYEALKSIRKGLSIHQFPKKLEEVQKKLQGLIQDCRIPEAYQLLEAYPPDVRAALKPFITHFSGSRTLIGTAKATMDFIQTIMMGSDALVSGQINLNGEFYGLTGTIGAPFVIGNRGVDRIIELSITDEELDLLSESVEAVQRKIKPYL